MVEAAGKLDDKKYISKAKGSIEVVKGMAVTEILEQMINPTVGEDTLSLGFITEDDHISSCISKNVLNNRSK